MKLIECVPNVSEGRDAAKLERIVAAVKDTAGVELLDWSADADHNRAVLTYVGEPEAVLAATQALCLEAVSQSSTCGRTRAPIPAWGRWTSSRSCRCATSPPKKRWSWPADWVSG